MKFFIGFYPDIVLKRNCLPYIRATVGERTAGKAVRCISSLENHSCPGASGPVPANDGLSTIIRPDSILPLVFPSSPRTYIGGISLRLSLPSPLGPFVLVSVFTLEKNTAVVAAIV